MIISLADLLRRVRYVIQDDAGTRWADAELRDYCLDGQVAIVDTCPWLSEQIVWTSHALASGIEQRIVDAGGFVSRVLDVTTNMSGSTIGKPIRKIAKDQLDAQRPGWSIEAPTLEIKNWMPMEHEQLAFLVYPPALFGARVRAQVVLVPEALDAIVLRDAGRDALIYYIVHKVWSKDADYSAGSAQYKTMFDAEIARLVAANQIAADNVHNRSRPK